MRAHGFIAAFSIHFIIFGHAFVVQREDRQRKAGVPIVSSTRRMLARGDDDGFKENPDLLGVYVDGFPLPPIPTRQDEEELLAKLRNVPSLDPSLALSPGPITQERPLRVLIAGGGLGGLTLGSALLRQGVDVHVLEQASRYKPFGGPIQIQSNALYALRKISPELYESIEACGVQTGDRLSGIKDGLRYKEGWLVKFDAATPARRKGLPLTLAINRVALQEIFLRYGIPPNRVHTNCRVLSYKRTEKNEAVAVAVEGQDHPLFGDILVGADGIWSRIRHQMHGLPPDEVGMEHASKHARYSGYTCFTGTCKHTPSDIDEVAYKVFLGQEQYLGCTDTGHGWQHWWAFLPDPPDKQTKEQDGIAMLERLKEEFRDWSPEIMDLFEVTDPKVVRRRPLFDRLPFWKEGWTDKNVVLLGDSAHCTLPNLGQGGAMAIEDAYVMAEELKGIQHTNEIPERLQAYERRRFGRASIAQFLSRNGSDLLVDWEQLRTTPIIGPIALWIVNVIQPITMNYLYSANI